MAEIASPAKRGRRTVICALEELPEGERRVVDINGRSVGVFHTRRGELYALRNICPHHGAQLCLGKVQSTIVLNEAGEQVLGFEDRILRCPWHGYEFDLSTGRSLTAPGRWRVRSYDVAIEDGAVVVYN
jgi:nitrite reductase/ring-hydroxylating ferredoxin subunit